VVFFVGIDAIEEMVRDQAPFRRGGLGRADVQVAIDLHRIGADDLGGKLFGQGQGQVRFPHPRGAGDDHQPGPIPLFA